MKKIYLLFSVLCCAFMANAQTFPNAGMETWRSSSAGGSSLPPVSPTTIHAPTSWYGFDSLIIADGQTFPYSLFFTGPLYAQLFQETTIIHGGSSSAKLITLKQDTLGFVPGILSNALPAVNLSQIETLLTSGGSPTGAITYSGGTAVTSTINTVSAWVEYIPGIDSTGAHAQDTGVLIVTAIKYIGGIDSIVGIGTIQIPPTGSGFVQITDSIVYTDTVDIPDTIRVNFASGGGGASRVLDSSILYVDDVSMYSKTAGVKSLFLNNDVVKVFPNPASNTLYINCLQNTGLSCTIYAANGQTVMTKQLAANNALDIAALPAGLYFYAISDDKGNTVQKGKVTLNK